MSSPEPAALSEIAERIESLTSQPRESYLLDKNAVDASVRQLTVLFETCHNIGKHLISRHSWRLPASKAETFEILAEQGILPRELAGSFVAASPSGTWSPTRRRSSRTRSSTRSCRTISPISSGFSPASRAGWQASGTGRGHPYRRGPFQQVGTNSGSSWARRSKLRKS